MDNDFTIETGVYNNRPWFDIVSTFSSTSRDSSEMQEISTYGGVKSSLSSSSKAQEIPETNFPEMLSMF